LTLTTRAHGGLTENQEWVGEGKEGGGGGDVGIAPLGGGFLRRYALSQTQ